MLQPKNSWSKIGLIICSCCIAAAFCIFLVQAVSGYGAFAMCVVFLIGVWLIGLISGFALTKGTRRYWFTMLTTTIVLLLFGAGALKIFKQDLRHSISTAFSGVVLSLASPKEQIRAQQSADRQAHFWEYLLDHY